ncbi:MAG: DUF935 family protein [Armatimonadetes bacterium]|nr:DUF935 family protein [Armatimonadota bacterium]
MKLFDRIKRRPLTKELAPSGIVSTGERLPKWNGDELIAKHGYAIYEKMSQDAHVKACLNAKRYALLSVGWRIEAADKSILAQRAARFCQDALNQIEGGLRTVLWNALDALSKGFSVQETIFAQSGSALVIRTTKAKDPSAFVFETDEFGNILALRMTTPDGRTIDLPPEKFIVYPFGVKYESPYGESDLKAAYKHWFAKDRLIRFWNVYLEKFATPTLIGTYQRGLPPQLQSELLEALERVQQETAIVTPEEVRIQALEIAQHGAGAYKEALAFHNAEISKSILGETLTVDEGRTVGSLALGQVHMDALAAHLRSIRLDLADRVAARQILKPLIELNLPGAPVPRFEWEESTRWT